MAYDLEFEKPLADIEKRIHTLQRKGDRLKSDDQAQLRTLERELQSKTEEAVRSSYAMANGAGSTA